MKKRILSILLLCCMVLTMLPAPAFAAEGETAHAHRTRAACANTTRRMTKPAAIPKGQRKFPVPMNTRRNVIVS